MTLSPLVRRVVANNPGPYTFTGTVSHIIGRGEVVVLDPGPDDFDHIASLLSATAGETITHILVSHTHRDHTDGVEALRAMTNAQIVGCAPRPEGERQNAIEGGRESDYTPARILAHGEVLKGPGWTLETVATPGHTSNHLAFALKEENALFSGDHVMAWSTTVVAPPDGNMFDYRASLRLLLERPEEIYYPAHGPSLTNAKPYVEGLLVHRQAREDQIITALRGHSWTVEEIVAAIYRGLSVDLQTAAGLSVLAHIQELSERGMVIAHTDDGPARFSLT